MDFLVSPPEGRKELAEILSKEAGNGLNSDHLFMSGLFSMLDVLMNQKLGKLLKELSIADEIKYSLLNASGK